MNKIFPNLKQLVFVECGLKLLSHNDLIGLENLTSICVVRNNLKSLPNDLFIGMKKLRKVSFFKNKIGFLSSELLKPILANGLISVDFGENPKIDAKFSTQESKKNVSLEELMDMMDGQCDKPLANNQFNEDFNYKFMKGFSQLRNSGSFSDFKIIAPGKEFNVHKAVLAMHSTVIAEKLDIYKTNEFKISDFSAHAVDQFLDYIYTGSIQEDSSAVELFAIAARFNVTKLMTMCKPIVLENLNESNAFMIFSLGHSHSEAEFVQNAFNEIKKNFPQMELEDDLMFDSNRLKTLIDADRNRQQKILEAEQEFQSIAKRSKKHN